MRHSSKPSGIRKAPERSSLRVVHGGPPARRRPAGPCRRQAFTSSRSENSQASARRPVDGRSRPCARAGGVVEQRADLPCELQLVVPLT